MLDGIHRSMMSKELLKKKLWIGNFGDNRVFWVEGESLFILEESLIK